MSHDGNNVGVHREPKPGIRPPGATTTKDNPWRSPPKPIRTKKCDILFRNEEIPEGMNFHVKSAMHQSIVFNLPRKITDPLDLIENIFEKHGPIEGFHHTISSSGNKLEICPGDPRIYQAIKKQDLIFQGHTLVPVIPTPTTYNVWKINFRHVPIHFTLKHFQEVFKGMGIIVEIGRYYWLIKERKVFTGEGFFFINLPRGKNPTIPEFIDLGGSYIQTRIANAPMLSATQHTNNANGSPLPSQPTNIAPPTQPAKKTGRKRNAKKRLKKNSGEHSHPETMEDIQDTNIPPSQSQQTDSSQVLPDTSEETNEME
ncbi:hypothetical protein BGX27_007983, partial [Mortierella sp. AM989]